MENGIKEVCTTNEDASHNDAVLWVIMPHQSPSETIEFYFQCNENGKELLRVELTQEQTIDFVRNLLDAYAEAII